jgi:hypothetical protein
MNSGMGTCLYLAWRQLSIGSSAICPFPFMETQPTSSIRCVPIRDAPIKKDKEKAGLP